MFIDFYEDGGVRLWMGGAWLSGKHVVMGDAVRVTPAQDDAFFAITAGLEPGKRGSFEMPFEAKDMIVWHTKTGTGTILRFTPNPSLRNPANRPKTP